MSYMQGNLVSNDHFDDIGKESRPSSLAEYTRFTRTIPTNIQKILLKGMVPYCKLSYYELMFNVV